MRENIVAIRFRGNPFDAAFVISREFGQMREQVVAHVFFVVGGGRVVHKRARQFENIHSNQASLDERNERKEPRGYKSGCRLSIALHPNKRMPVNGPWTHSPT